MAGQGFLEGGISGAGTMASTGNPWLIGAGFLGGGILGHMGEEADKPRQELISQINRANLAKIGREERMENLTLRESRRAENIKLAQAGKKRIIGRQLGRYFANVR